MRAPTRTERRHRRGNSTMIALSIVSLMGFAAMAIDLGSARLADAQLQAALDASAHAALGSLNGTADGMDAAIEEAVWMASLQQVNGRPLVLDPDSDVILGVYDFETAAFEAFDPDVHEVTEVNAVRVAGGQTDLSRFFIDAIAPDVTLSVASTATSARTGGGGAGAVDCFIPLGIPRCLLEEHDPEDVMDMNLVLSPAGIDNTGWAAPVKFGASDLREQLADCTAFGTATVGDTVYLDNGVKTSVMSTLADEIDASTTGWNEDLWGDQPAQMPGSAVEDYGGTYEGPFLVFDTDDDDYCDAGGGQWNGTGTLVGFAWGAIYDVRTQGKAAEKNIRVRMDLLSEREIGRSGGGEDYGISAAGTPRIVQ